MPAFYRLRASCRALAGLAGMGAATGPDTQSYLVEPMIYSGFVQIPKRRLRVTRDQGDAGESGREQVPEAPVSDQGSSAVPSAEERGPTSIPPTGDELPIRVCPKCSTQSKAAGEHCPHCGAAFVRGRRKLGKRGRRLALALFVLLLAAGGATAYIVKHDHDQQVKKDRARAHAREVALAARHRKAAEAARLKAAEHRLKVSVRKPLIADLQRSVTKDATKDAADGVFTGPILRTSCEPSGGGSIDDLTQHSGNYSCLAITKDNGDGTSSGYRFSATVNYDKFSYTWHLGG